MVGWTLLVCFKTNPHITRFFYHRFLKIKTHDAFDSSGTKPSWLKTITHIRNLRLRVNGELDKKCQSNKKKKTLILKDSDSSRNWEKKVIWIRLTCARYLFTQTIECLPSSFWTLFFLILHHPSISHRNGLNSWIFLTRCYDERLCIFHILFISIIAWWELMVRPTYVHITSHHIYAIMWCKERLFKGLAQHRRVLFHKWIFCIRFNERVSALLAEKGLHRKKIKFRRRNHHSRTETTFWLAERKKKTSFDNFKPCFSSISSTIFRTK